MYLTKFQTFVDSIVWKNSRNYRIVEDNLIANFDKNGFVLEASFGSVPPFKSDFKY